MVESHRSCYSFTYSRFIPCENSRYAVYGFRTGLTPRPCVWEWGQFAWCNFTSEAVPQSKCSHLAYTCFSSSAMHEFQNLHAKSKDKIHDFVRGHFYGWVVAMATTICLIFSSDFMIGNCVLFTMYYVSPLYLHARIHKILCICTHTCTHTYLHIQTHNTYMHTQHIFACTCMYTCTAIMILIWTTHSTSSLLEGESTQTCSSEGFRTLLDKNGRNGGFAICNPVLMVMKQPVVSNILQ